MPSLGDDLSLSVAKRLMTPFLLFFKSQVDVLAGHLIRFSPLHFHSSFAVLAELYFLPFCSACHVDGSIFGLIVTFFFLVQYPFGWLIFRLIYISFFSFFF